MGASLAVFQAIAVIGPEGLMKFLLGGHEMVMVMRYVDLGKVPKE